MHDDAPPPDPSPFRRLSRIFLRSVLALALLLAVGNGAILAASALARTSTEVQRLDLDGVAKAVAVDDKLWRGAAPSAAGYRSLRAAGVTTIVDLRSDSERGEAVESVDEVGLALVRLPIRDGQLPTDEELATFLQVVDGAQGKVFVHCGAGVGRTGAVVAAYSASHGAAAAGAVRRNLAVGPPSLEQIAFAAGGGSDPGPAITAMSRVLDAPRRIWHNLT